MKPSTEQLRKISDRGKKTNIRAIHGPCKDERGKGVVVLRGARSKFGGEFSGTNTTHETFICRMYVAIMLHIQKYIQIVQRKFVQHEVWY